MSGQQSNKISAFNTVMSVLLLIWFMGSIFGLIYYGGQNDGLGILIVLGQFFFLIGIGGAVSVIRDHNLRKGWPVLALPLIGGVMLACGIILSMNIRIPMYVLVLLCINIFTVTGLAMLVSGPANTLYVRKKCTVELPATCVEVSESSMRVERTYNSKHQTVYMPVYEIYWNGAMLRVSDRCYTADCPAVGERVMLRINPNNPFDFQDERGKKSNWIPVVLGILFLLCGIGVSVLILSGNSAIPLE